MVGSGQRRLLVCVVYREDGVEPRRTLGAAVGAAGGQCRSERH